MAVNIPALGAAMNAAVASVQAAIKAAGTLAGASLSTIAPVAAAVSAALPSFVAAVSALDADITITSVAGAVPGTPVPVMVATILAQTSEVQHLAVALNAQAYLARMGVNLSNATG